jgi:hypothetical protein
VEQSACYVRQTLVDMGCNLLGCVARERVDDTSWDEDTVSACPEMLKTARRSTQVSHPSLLS